MRAGLCPVVVMLQVLFAAGAVAGPDSSGLGTGRDGEIKVTRKGAVINHYAQVTGPLTSGDTLLLAAATAGFEAGDLVMVLQTASLIPASRRGEPGPIELTQELVEGWELARVESVGQGKLVLKEPLRRSYAASVTQVIRVPEYSQITILKGASLVAAPWNGETGGVLAFVANGTIHNDGEIGASGCVLFIRGSRLTGGGFIQEQVLTAGAVTPFPGAGESLLRVNVPPDTNITSAPPARVRDANARFEFAAEGGTGTLAGFDCKLDQARFEQCNGGFKEYGPLSDGRHVFQVRARDTDGYVDPTSSEYQWDIDTTAPETTITSAPPEMSNATNATFTFRANEAGLGIRCKLDSDSEESCNDGTISYRGLSEGVHVFEVYAVDLVGNVESPTPYRWTVDVTPPDIRIVSKPPERTASPDATFTFLSSDQEAGYECSLSSSSNDNFAECFSPKIYSGLQSGTYAFKVRAKDRAGNVSSPEGYVWIVDTSPPSVTIERPTEGQRLNTPSPVISGTTEAYGHVKIFIGGQEAGGTPVGSDGRWSLNSSAVLLANGTYTVTASATDFVGNQGPMSNPVTFIIDTEPPDTRIDDAPPAQHNRPISKFDFSSTGAASFECSVDGAAFEPCEADARFRLGEGSHVLLVRAKDEAGNVDPSPMRHDWVVLLTPPPPPEILEPQNGAVVYTYTPTISGTAAPGSEVEIFIAGKSIGKKKAEEDTGHWEIISTELAEGAYEIQGKSTDEAGNDSPSFTSLSFTVKPPRDQAQAIGGGLACASSGPLPQLVVLGGIIGMLLRTRRPRR